MESMRDDLDDNDIPVTFRIIKAHDEILQWIENSNVLFAKGS